MDNRPAEGFLLLGHELQRARPDRGVQRRRAHRSDDEVRLGNRSRYEARGDAFHVHDDEAALAVMQLNRLHNGGFGDLREDAHPIGRAACVDHHVRERFGSQSIMVTGTPAWAISVPSKTAAVDLPAPPFGETITTVGIAT